MATEQVLSAAESHDRADLNSDYDYIPTISAALIRLAG